MTDTTPLALRNKAGQLAIVVPWGGASEAIKEHGGKVVMPVRYTSCALGPAAWLTDPELKEENGLVLAWDDRDLKPLGGGAAPVSSTLEKQHD